MVIKTQEDWVELAKNTIPLLPEYMDQYRGGVNQDMVLTELNTLFSNKNWKKLHSRFNEIWSWLPDRPDIRRHPFFDLCDLCSEYWVFEDK